MPTIEFFLSDRIIDPIVKDLSYIAAPVGGGNSKGIIIAVTFGTGAPAQATAREAYGLRDPITGVPDHGSLQRTLCPHPPGCTFTLTGDIVTDQKENLIDDDCFL